MDNATANRIALSFLVLVTLIAPATAYTPDTLTVTFLNVGSADAIIVQAPNGNAMLVDAGEPGDASTVTAALASEGITRLAYVVATHDHQDHIGGMADVLRSMPVGEYVNNGLQDPTPIGEVGEIRTLLGQEAIPVLAAKAGDTIALDPVNVTVNVLSPAPALVDPALVGVIDSDDLNEASVVLRLVFGGESILLAGDAQKKAESGMCSSGQTLSAQVLKVGHHGSETSTTAPFLAAVNPETAVISVGANDGSGNPDPATEARLRANGVTLYETKDYGTVVITATRMAYTVGNAATPIQPVSPPIVIPIVIPIQPSYPDQPISQPIIPVSPGTAQPVFGPQAPPAFVFGKQYVIGDPGSFLGAAAADGAMKIVAPPPRAVVTQAATSNPGTPEYGMTPPTRPYVRWYPGARWGTGNP